MLQINEIRVKFYINVVIYLELNLFSVYMWVEMWIATVHI